MYRRVLLSISVVRAVSNPKALLLFTGWTLDVFSM